MVECKKCGKKCEKDYCFHCKPKKGLSRGHLKAYRAPQRHYKPKDDVDVHLMQKFFLQVWNKRKHISEISGEKLLSPISSLYFHHILPKSKYKEAMYDEENIILLTPIEHGNVENNPQRYEIINNKRDYLLKKYSNFGE
jgi:hypothetical protein